MAAHAVSTETASSTSIVANTIDDTFRNHGTRILASLIRSVGDFELAEDAFQDALTEAIEKWPGRGIPENPAGWIMTTARRRSIDRVRRAANLRDKQRTIEYLARHDSTFQGIDASEPEIPDERLRLIFTCCHPALPLESQVALTLRTVGGLTTEQIAAAFLVPTATMGQRISRSKRKMRDAGIPFVIPDRDQLPTRLSAVLAVIYLIFNEGYSSGESEDSQRLNLVDEATKLAAIVAGLLPDEPESIGLLALLLLQNARRDARRSPTGETVLLKDQDRDGWDQARITEGLELLDRALGMGRPGPYQIQAAIAALHSQAGSIDETDWTQIALLYIGLYEFNRSPVIRLNHAVAIAEAFGARAGLEMLDEQNVSSQLISYAPYWVARSELLLRIERHGDALAALYAARDVAQTDLERANIARRLREFPEPPR
ncbi:sigma factor [soil metagenome]